MKQELQKTINEIGCEKLRKTCECLDFGNTPASLSFHHAYEGGLLAHTLEVARYARAMALVMPNVDSDILLTSALWHDAEKRREYVVVFDFEENQRGLKRKAGGWWVKKNTLFEDHAHIVKGAITFTQSADGVAPDVVEQIQHCILSHHGRKEWGSPVEPQTVEALILHQADMLSAKYGEGK